jgi:hypothetical protein
LKSALEPIARQKKLAHSKDGKEKKDRIKESNVKSNAN